MLHFRSLALGRFDRLRVVAALAAFSAAAIAVATAGAAHWPMHGGDAGHSGHQVVDPTGQPVRFVYAKDETAPIRTSIITSAGSDASRQLVIYSTTDGSIHHRPLDDGEPHLATKFVITPDYVPDADVIGSGRGQVAPVEASRPGALGYTYQVFNEDAGSPTSTDGDVVLSVFDQKDGDLIATTRIGGATGNTFNYSINQSPILFQDALWFVITPDAAAADPNRPPAPPNSVARLVKVPINDPAGVSGRPTIGTPVIIEAANANGLASATGMWLRDPASAEGAVRPYVALSFTSGNSVRTFTADTPTPAAGPQSADLVGGSAFTPSVPVRADGMIPQPAPYIYVAVQETEPVSDYAGGARVHKLRQNPTAPASLVAAPDESNRSPVLLGNAAPGLAVNQVAGTTTTSGGHIVVTTSCDVYSIAADDMTRVRPLLGPNAPDGCPNDTAANPAGGFGQTVAALSGSLGFVQRNNGDQIAFEVLNMTPLPGDQFQEHEAETIASSAFGQPSISRRFVQFGDNRRLTVYRAEIPVPPGESGAGFSINDVTVTEGNSGEQAAVFTVTRTGSLGGTVKVQTADNSANAGSDYTAVNGTVLSFTDDEVSKTISVPIIPDTVDEPDETFFVRLSEPGGSGARIIDGEGLGTITDDDEAPAPASRLTVTDVTALEGTPATFSVSLSSPAAGIVTVDYGTGDDTARQPGDYTPVRGTLTFAPGETTKTVSVPVLKDRLKEPVERFYLGIANARGADVADNLGAALIGDVAPDRLRARGFTARTTPSRDTTRPWRFTTRGRLIRPTAVPASRACRGRVSVQVKAGKKTISTRRAKLKRDCTFRSRVTFTESERFGSAKRLRFTARFLGNADVFRRTAKTQTVRVR